MNLAAKDKRLGAGRLLGGAAVFAAAELALATGVGGFFIWGRAEALLFFAFRPWLLLIAALLVARFGWRDRWSLFALALVLAGLSESLLLLELGADNPWPEMLRGWAAGVVLLAVLDAVLQIGRRLYGRIGQSVATVILVLLLVLPGAMRPYEAIALGPTGPHPAGQRPDLMLMTGLPIIWGETGPFDPQSRPAAFYRELQREFDVRPIDYLDEESLADGKLMLLAQPRALAPEELVALDEWVRGGGRVLILADPHLVWPTRLPLGDIRRPPPVSLLGPLLRHWGVGLRAEDRPRLAVEHVQQKGQMRRLTLAAPGRFVPRGENCRLAGAAWLADCRMGRGRALLLADGDLLRDEMWAAPTPRGSERHARTADNPLAIASWLDDLGGIERQRTARHVIWQRPSANRLRAIAIALVPILLGFAAAILARRRHR